MKGLKRLSFFKCRLQGLKNGMELGGLMTLTICESAWEFVEPFVGNTKMEGLNTLELGYCHLRSLEFLRNRIFDSLKELKIHNNKFADKCAQEESMLSQYKNVRLLRLNGNTGSVSGLEDYAFWRRKFPNLEELEVEIESYLKLYKKLGRNMPKLNMLRVHKSGGVYTELFVVGISTENEIRVFVYSEMLGENIERIRVPRRKRWKTVNITIQLGECSKQQVQYERAIERVLKGCKNMETLDIRLKDGYGPQGRELEYFLCKENRRARDVW